ncbi:YdeI family protein [Cellulomonas sp. C5510]|uniref:YdeI/OmpD-associated family protein n=1 Tax=Cellulomonas sp. C5510 TaxID=2871170 RepID=UPI001C989B77|nr:YdeI/OmpD-associated family protein [Cellulomonas sp. C5510]QZN84864.1 YdeI/OmpD-associated family protein [Cellulomonas sp. C5510]
MPATTPAPPGRPAPAGPPPTLTVPDVAAWRTWLDAHEDDSDGVWLVLARKGVVDPTSLTYAEALDEALCSGWIDGQRRGGDAATFLQRFVPRRARSLWSQRNVEHVARLVAEGRLRERGQAEVDRARADGRWERAYAGQASAEVPADLLAALDAVPGARARFDALGRQQRYSVLHPLMTAPGDAVRATRLERAVRALSSPPDDR